jgi:hypothetical protein
MKLQKNPRAGEAGVALILVLILVGVSLLILAGVMNRSQTVATLNQRNNEYNLTCNAAEAAVEKAYARMAFDFQAYGLGQVSNNLAIYRTNIPSAGENAFWSDYQFSDAQGQSGRTYVSYLNNYSGALPSSYVGLSTLSAPVYRIVSNAQLSSSRYGVVGTAQEDVLLSLVPLSTMAIFYNGLLEFSQCATMVVNGRVHANGSIYAGTSASLTFNGGVTTTTTLTAPLVDGLTSGWTPNTANTWNTTFNASPGYQTNVASMTVSLNMTNSHFLIDIPPAGEAPSSAIGQQRLYNEAQFILLVTNAPSGSGIYSNPTVQVILQANVDGTVPGNDPYPTVLTYTNATLGVLQSNLPFLSLTNSFFDQREQKTNLVTQINVGTYNTWATTNAAVQNKLPAASGIYPTIMYVADQRTVLANQLAVVRLANASQIPQNNNLGFSVATMNPLYTVGNFNVQVNGSASQSTQQNNPANKYPSALLSDSLTILSGNWTDAQSFTTYNNSASVNDATETTINAAIVTGTMPSTGTTATTFSGGVHNLPRMLEDWSNINMWLNTSILRLYDSQMATNQFRNPQGFTPSPVKPYYNPPLRHFSFDTNFLDPTKIPPGIPTVLVPIRFGWGTPPPSNTTYTIQHN